MLHGRGIKNCLWLLGGIAGAMMACSATPESDPDELGAAPAGEPAGEPVGLHVHRPKGERAPRDGEMAAPSDSNGISPHGGPVMTNINIYYIWYGNWTGNTATTILPYLASHIGGSAYWNINTTYYDTLARHVPSTVRYAGSTTDSYSRGVTLTDDGVLGVVSDAITSGRLPADDAGVYFVLGSPDVTETSGFCTKYCGWHHAPVAVSGTSIKYAFVGDAATQCPGTCMVQSNGPNNNGGADGMASVIIHELEETATDPNLDAWVDVWFDVLGREHDDENADKCAWKFGAGYVAPNGMRANIRLGARDYLIQQNWANESGGHCAMGDHYESLGGPLPSAPAVSSWAPGRLDVFARGADASLQHKWYDGAWHAWESVAGTLTSEPAAVSWGPGVIDVFARGPDNGLMHIGFNGTWHSWEALGGVLTTRPAVSSWAPGRLDVFARGTDNALHHRWYDGTWHGWESLGGVLTSEPTAVSWGPGRIDVFVRGTDNALHHLAYDGAWHGWESLGGTLDSGPTVASWGAGELDVFARSTDNTLLHKAWNAGAWGSLESLGNTTLSSPAAVSWSFGRVDVLMMGESSALWHKWFDYTWFQ